MTNHPFERAREICLAFPEAHEKEAWGSPTFRVRDKMFAHFVDNHHEDGRVAVWLKAPPGAQEVLAEANPERFFVPPYVGHRGWIGVIVDPEPDWEEFRELAEEGYRMTAPKKLLAVLDLERQSA